MPNEHVEYSGEVDMPVEAIQIVDPNVLAKLPSHTQVTEITAHGASFWTRSARLDAIVDGIPKLYFLKTSYGDRGRDLVPWPIAWGTYASIPDVHFFLCNFHDMTDELPDLDTFPAKLADLHRNGTSPNGKFGFPVTTYHGNTPLVHGWSDTWEGYFTRTTRVLLQMELAVHGPNQDLAILAEPFFSKVVPRLLRPLETGGRSIKPCLVHGDLWYGNASMDADTDTPIIFDAACLYAHNEYDLGVWRATWNRIGRPYITQYHEHFQTSPPEDDGNDRGMLYATRVNILDSILYKANQEYRGKLISGMKALVEKYPEGLDGLEKAQKVSSSVTVRAPKINRADASQDKIKDGKDAITSMTVNGEHLEVCGGKLKVRSESSTDCIEPVSRTKASIERKHQEMDFTNGSRSDIVDEVRRLVVGEGNKGDHEQGGDKGDASLGGISGKDDGVEIYGTTAPSEIGNNTTLTEAVLDGDYVVVADS